MATLRAVTVLEQNANTLAGAQVTSATYVGTNVTADLVIRVGRDAALINLVGTQTASRTYVSLDTANAYNGAQVVVTRNCASPGTGIISFFSGGAGTGFAAGAEVSTIAASVNGVNVFVYDGVNQVWR